MDTFLSGVLEMGRTEHGRSGDNDHVNTRVDDVLVSVEADKAMIIRNFLLPFLFQLVLEVVKPVSESVSKSSDGDSVSGVEKVDDGT